MRKLVYVIIILFMLSGCTQNISTSQKVDITQTEVEGIAPEDGLRDLLHRVYKGGIKLEKGAKVYIPEPDIEF